MNEPLGERALRRLLAMAAADDAAAPRAAPHLPPRYEVVRELGRGGMGIVYEVIDHQLGRRIALKTLGAGAGADDELRARFAREAAAAAKLRHPHIAAVHDATPDCITMQLVDGGPIGVVPAIDLRLAVQLVRDAAHALQHAHEMGIVHRDLKPSNLLVEGTHVYVVDFGLAKSLDATGSVSLAGSLVGTPAFMAPEQALGRTGHDARCDVYGLGATLYHCVTGRAPFVDDDLPALLRRVVEDDPAPAGVDADLDLVLARCLAKEPEHRYQSARELADDLDRWLRDEPVHARRPTLLYRLRKRWRRQRVAWRAAAVAAIAAVAVTALVLIPRMLRENAASTAASEAVELADHVATVLQDVAMLTQLGDEKSARQRAQGGLQRVREFLQQHDVARVRHLHARLLQAANQPEEALAELERALALDPELADARFQRGLLLAARLELSPADRALAIADLGVEVRDRSVVRDVDRLFGKAEQLRLRGDSRRAMDLLKEVLEYDGMHVAARLSLAAAARELGDDALSVYYSSSAFDLQQGYGPFYLARERLALATSILGLEGLLVDFSGDLQDAPGNAHGLAQRGLVQLRRAVRLESEGQLPAALEAVRGAIDDHDGVLTLHEHLAGAFNNRAVCRLVAEQLHRRTGDVAAGAEDRSAAATDAAAALQLVPSLPAAHFNSGLAASRQADVLRAMGRVDAAARENAAAASAFTAAIELAPADWPHLRTCRDHLEAVQAATGSPR